MAVSLRRMLTRFDGWQNLITSLGRARDKRTSTYIKPAIIQGGREEFDNWYHSDHTAQKIARLPAREMVREWITIRVDDSIDDTTKEATTGDKLITSKQIMQGLEDIEAQSKVMEALVWSRVHGGAVIFLGADDGNEDLSEPLNMDNIKSFDFMTVFDRWEAQISTVVTDVTDQRFGQPETYVLYPQTHLGGVGQEVTPIHASRFVRIDGVRTTRYRMANNSGWSDSVYTAMRETLQDFGISWAAVTHLLTDFSQAVFKMKGLHDALLQSESDLVLERMNNFDICRSVARAIPIDADSEDFLRAQTPMSGLPETLDRLMLRIAEAAEMPATLLFGQSPSGLQATGDSDIRFFYDSIKAKQEEVLRPALDRIIEVLLASKDGPTGGKEPENWSYTFDPLWQESDKEQAETRKIQAEADSIYIQDGVLDPDEVAMSRFGGDSYSTDTVLDMEKRAEMEDMPEPEPPAPPTGLPQVQTVPLGQAQPEEPEDET